MSYKLFYLLLELPQELFAPGEFSCIQKQDILFFFFFFTISKDLHCATMTINTGHFDQY